MTFSHIRNHWMVLHFLLIPPPISPSLWSSTNFAPLTMKKISSFIKVELFMFAWNSFFSPVPTLSSFNLSTSCLLKFFYNWFFLLTFKYHLSSVLVCVNIIHIDSLISLPFPSSLDLSSLSFKGKLLERVVCMWLLLFHHFPLIFQLTQFLASTCIAPLKLLWLTSLIQPHTVKFKDTLFLSS